MSKKLSLILGSFFVLFVGIASASLTTDIMPTGDGAYTQWTKSSGLTHYTLVDESSCNGVTDYNFTTTVGNRDSYVVSTSQVSNGSQITKIEIKPCASRNSGGGASPVMNVFYSLNGSNSADAGAYSLTGTTPVQLATTTFSGLSAIKTGTTTLEVGSVLTSGIRGARLSRIATVITYTALNAPSGLGATTTSSSQINLGWSDNSTFEDGFVIERQNVTASSTFSVIATTTANVVGYSDMGLASSTVYKYKVRAYNIGGYSNYSNTATATTTP